MIHCGSRGLGHQICTDHVQIMDTAMGRYGITVPDRQLACAPAGSPEGRGYLGAMAAAANYGRANRQLLAEAVHAGLFPQRAGAALDLVYDVSHNLAKIETHPVGGIAWHRLCVHRKGATRALPPGHPRPARRTCVTPGQPVLIPGSMGTSSYVLAGVPDGGAFASDLPWRRPGDEPAPGAACRCSGPELRRRLRGRGHRSPRRVSRAGLAEETPEAYTDVNAGRGGSRRRRAVPQGGPAGPARRRQGVATGTGRDNLRPGVAVSYTSIVTLHDHWPGQVRCAAHLVQGRGLGRRADDLRHADVGQR